MVGKVFGGMANCNSFDILAVAGTRADAGGGLWICMICMVAVGVDAAAPISTLGGVVGCCPGDCPGDGTFLGGDCGLSTWSTIVLFDGDGGAGVGGGMGVWEGGCDGIVLFELESAG